MKIQTSLQEFCQYATEANIIAVVAEFSSDMDTPVSLYYKLVGDDLGFILESADKNKYFGRYSFLGTKPLASATAFKSYVEVTEQNNSFKIVGNPVNAMKEYISKFKTVNMPELPPLMSGGVIGYFAYDSIGTWERVRGFDIPEDLVLGQFLLCKILVVVDHLKHTSKLVCLAQIQDGVDVTATYNEAVAEINNVYELLKQDFVKSKNAKQANNEDLFINEITQSKDEYLKNVEIAKEHIAAADIFQVVLAKQFRCKISKEPFAFYRRLRQVNPSPYMFYINFGKRKLVGASPEMLVKIADDTVYTYPIAGTRPRGANDAEDADLTKDLLNDPKECAEHAMLVDLGRNDVGKISVPGSVRVTKLMDIELFSHVIHMVSEVAGKINPTYQPLDVLASCFPAGTLSGAPKVRAMEIINNLEGVHRGPYGGAVGYFDFCGNMDMCITIRTITIDEDVAIVQTGAGIVADSVPENEYNEVLQKAKVMFQVIKEVEADDFTN